MPCVQVAKVHLMLRGRGGVHQPAKHICLSSTKQPFPQPNRIVLSLCGSGKSMTKTHLPLSAQVKWFWSDCLKFPVMWGGFVCAGVSVDGFKKCVIALEEKPVTSSTYSAGHLHLQQRLEVLLEGAERRGLLTLLRLGFQRAPAVQEHKELTPPPQHANGPRAPTQRWRGRWLTEGVNPFKEFKDFDFGKTYL